LRQNEDRYREMDDMLGSRASNRSGINFELNFEYVWGCYSSEIQVPS